MDSKEDGLKDLSQHTKQKAIFHSEFSQTLTVLFRWKYRSELIQICIEGDSQCYDIVQICWQLASFDSPAFAKNE